MRNDQIYYDQYINQHIDQYIELYPWTRVINYPDFMLYEHFNATFWSRIERIGFKNVQEMVQKIRIYSKKLADECVQDYREVENWNGKMIKGPEFIHRPKSKRQSL